MGHIEKRLNQKNLSMKVMKLSQNPWLYKIHSHAGGQTAELTSQGIAISSPQDFLDFMGDLSVHEVGELILYEKNIAPAFFELRTGLAGEILQKCSNYEFRLALVGDFSHYNSESLQAFIRESNRGRLVFFVATVEEALQALGNK